MLIHEEELSFRTGPPSTTQSPLICVAAPDDSQADIGDME